MTSRHVSPDAGTFGRAMEHYLKFDRDPTFSFWFSLVVTLFIGVPIALSWTLWVALIFLIPLFLVVPYVGVHRAMSLMDYDRTYGKAKESFARLNDPALRVVGQPLLQEIWAHSLYHNDNYCQYCVSREELIEALLPVAAVESYAVKFAKEFLESQKALS